MLTQVLVTLPLLITGLVLGGMAFFAFVFAPLVFMKLPQDTAGAFIRQVFPVYYRAVAIMTVLASVTAWASVEGLVLALVAIAALVAWLGLMPRINLARDASTQDAAAAKRFARLHRISVVINAVQMIALLIVFIRLAS